MQIEDFQEYCTITILNLVSVSRSLCKRREAPNSQKRKQSCSNAILYPIQELFNQMSVGEGDTLLLPNKFVAKFSSQIDRKIILTRLTYLCFQCQEIVETYNHSRRHYNLRSTTGQAHIRGNPPASYCEALYPDNRPIS